MPENGDTVMLKFYINHKYIKDDVTGRIVRRRYKNDAWFDDIYQEYNYYISKLTTEIKKLGISPNNSFNHAEDNTKQLAISTDPETSFNHTELIKQEMAVDKEKLFMEILSISKELDENTRVIFAIEFLDLIPISKYFLFISGLNIKNKYNLLYLRMKVSEILIKNKLFRMAVLYLIDTSLGIDCGSDIQLKNELIKIALALIKNKTWRKEFSGVLELIMRNETEKYGVSILDHTFSKSTDNMHSFGLELCKIDAEELKTEAEVLEFSSFFDIFEFNLFKVKSTDLLLIKLK